MKYGFRAPLGTCEGTCTATASENSDGARVGARRMRDDRDVRPVGPDPELVDGRGPERVCRGEDDRPPLPDVASRHLADRRGLAGPVHPDHENDGRTARDGRARAPGEVTRDEQCRQLRPDRGLGSRRVAILAGTLDEVDRERRTDVAGDQRLQRGWAAGDVDEFRIDAVLLEDSRLLGDPERAVNHGNGGVRDS